MTTLQNMFNRVGCLRVQLYLIQTKIMNNVNVHFQPKIYSQHYYPKFAAHMIGIIELN